MVATIRAHFPKIRALFFPNFEKVQERPPIPTPTSYAPVVIRKYRIPLLTKFTHEIEN